MEGAVKTFRLHFRSLSRLFLLRLLSHVEDWSLQDKFDEEAKRQRVAEFIVEPKPQLEVPDQRISTTIRKTPQDLIIKKTKKGDICKLDQMDPTQKTEVATFSLA